MNRIEFKQVFIAVLAGGVLLTAAFFFHAYRPATETDEPGADSVRASGKCAECHRNEASAVVVQFEKSAHAAKGVNCFDCHRAAEGQQKIEHRGFEITTDVTSKNCAGCHSTQHEQFLKSRHGAPAWAAVHGSKDFTEEQIAFSEKYHKGAVKRKANALAQLEGESATTSGCESCHSIGAPNEDGSIGSCTECHSRHNTSLALARQPETCGQCHMGPDHSQLEIYKESKHGVMFHLQKAEMNLSADPQRLTTKDMPVPTCSTCHMSGIEGLKFTHDVSERLSYWLFAPVSKKRPDYRQAKDNMQEVCLKCHTDKSIEKFYKEAEAVVVATNKKVKEMQAVMSDLRKRGLLTPEPFDEPIEFAEFDYWHYFGRTAKHGAFMGGADYVQWHGNYELLLKLVEIKEMAEEIKKGH